MRLNSLFRALAPLRICLAAAACAALACPAQADIGVVIADPTNAGSSAYTHAGHTMVYLSGVCPASPIQARLCRPGEQGSVVTIFPNFREDKPYEWNIIPLSLYLEGSLQPGNRLLYGSHAVKAALGDEARTGYFSQVCEHACPAEAHSYWRDLVAATIDRDIFIYAVKTTRAQDEAAVRWINAQPNVNHYNGITSNCAMYVQSIVNSIFPHVIHRDFLNDIGLMSPKAAAHSFSRWAQKHPELGFYSMHFAQKPGSIRRSGTASSGTEAAIHIKKYWMSAALIGDHEVAGSFFVAYLLTDRFSLYKESTHYATPTLTELEAERRTEVHDGEQQQAQATKQEIVLDRAEITGTLQEWQDYQRRFAAIAEAADLTGDPHMTQFLKRLDGGSVSVDRNGDSWLTCSGQTARVGLNSANILSEDSDPELAFDLLAWRIGYSLKAKPRMRPNIEEFRQDWALFQQAYENWRPLEARGASAASQPAGASSVGAGFLPR
jgi:uncharacterized protein YbaA (DUF1428 family)